MERFGGEPRRRTRGCCLRAVRPRIRLESFQPQISDVQEPQPFVLGCPPERTRSTIVQGHVNPVIADAVLDRVRHGQARTRVGVLAVDGGCDLMVERERIPGEAAVRPKRAATRSKQRRRSAHEADAAETGRGSRSRPPVPRLRAPVYLLRAGRARLPPHPRAFAPARASPEKSQSRPRACPLPEQPGSQRARYQPQVRPVARQPHGQAQRRTGRQQDARRPVGVSIRPSVVPVRHSNTNLRPNEVMFGWASVLSPECGLGQSASSRLGHPPPTRRPRRDPRPHIPARCRAPAQSQGDRR